MQHLLLPEFVKNALSRPDTNIFQGSFDDEKFGLLEQDQKDLLNLPYCRAMHFYNYLFTV